MPRLARTVLLVLTAAALATVHPADAEVDPATFGGLRARAIGPASMSGRIAALDVHADDPLTLFVGTASGGLWKSADGGVTFKPVFDEHSQSIGAVRIDPTNPAVVWVGTGESWTRNSTSAGSGVYKTTNGGDHWTATGLADSERIARIVVHPRQGDVVYVCATGHLWNANPERGVYKTADGGATWERVLYVDEDTGCSDLAMDPQQPEILYAGMWQFRRLPWTFTSGGPGSGLYKSTDGGATWRELTRGLPDGDKGRIAVAVSPARASRVYAVVEAARTAFYSSDDLGESWTALDGSFTVTGRPFYFAYVVPDPVDFDRVYKPGFLLGVSSDGGRTFDNLAGSTHSDHHALWVNPRNPHELVLGTDGGVYMSFDRGARWRFVGALPVSQFYEVSHDMAWPYNVYGGLQDNGTWTGPSRSVGGIKNKDWDNIGFGDGFHAFPDPSDDDLIYVEYQGGNVLRVRRSTGETKDIKPYAAAGEDELRFNWNTPIHLSPSRPGTLYVGAQFLFRSRDRGESWERISPDLTTDDPAKQRQRESGGLTVDNSTAENHTTIYTIAESPLDPDVIWVGTDDGNLQVTRDGGRSWENVVSRVPGLPANTWVSHVEASPHAEGAAFVTFDGHNTGDMTTYVYRTSDLGQTWESLAGEGLSGWAHVVKQDPVHGDLLFLGTETGLYLSLDGGAGWAHFLSDLPPVPVRDLKIHPRDHDLVIGTHGRGIYILDDLTPLRHLDTGALEAEVALLPTRPAPMVLPAALQEFPGDDQFVGANPPEAATIAYHLKKRHLFGDLKVEIYDPQGGLVATLPAGKRKGLNRVDWPMRLPPPRMPPSRQLVFQPFSLVGPRVSEGAYRVRLVKGDASYDGEVSLVADPRSQHSAEDRAAQQRMAMELYRLFERLSFLVDRILDLQEQAAARRQALGDGRGPGARLAAFGERLEALRARLVATSGGFVSGEEQLREKLGYLYGAVNGYDGRPSQSQIERLAALAAQLEERERDFDGACEELADLNRQLAARGLEAVSLLTREAWEARDEAAGGGGPPAEGMWRLLPWLPF